MRARSAQALVVAVVLVAGAIASSVTQVRPGSVASAAGLPTVPAPIAAVMMACGPGQVDLNSAPAATIGSTFSLSDPVVQRLIGYRPFLRVDPDLLVVQGIGPDTLAAIVATQRACVLPPSVPPSTFDVCQAPGDNRVDANRPESRARLAGIFGGPTADRIVAHEPYWRLDLLAAELDAGAGPGKLSKNRDQLCVTPPTIDLGGTRYGWIGGAGGVVTRIDTRGAYTLTAGSSVINNPAGAWGTVTQVADPVGLGVPAADLHIFGDWTGQVWATMPPDVGINDDTHQFTQAIGHQVPNDVEIHSGPTVVHGADGRNSTPLTSLSTVFGVQLPSWELIGQGLDTLVGIADRLIRIVLGTGGSPPSCSPNITDTSGSGGWSTKTIGLPTSGASPELWHCVEGPPAALDTWRFVNNRGIVFDLANARGGAYLPKPGADRGPVLGALLVWALNRIHQSDGYQMLATGQPADVGVRAPSGALDVRADEIASLAYEAFANLTALFGPFVNAVYEVAVSCPRSWVGNVSELHDGPSAFYWAVSSLNTLLHDCLANSVELFQKLGRTLPEWGEEIVRAATFLKYAHWAAQWADYQTAGGIESQYPTVLMQLQPPAPSSPPPAFGGGTNPGGGPDGTIVSDTSSGQTLLVKLGGGSPPPVGVVYRDDPYVLHYAYKPGQPALDPDLYYCLARRLKLRDWLPSDKLLDYARQESNVVASCDPAWPEGVLPTNATNWILRKHDGTAIFIDANSHAHAIPDGGTYICLAQRYYVLDERTQGELDQFPGLLVDSLASCP